MSVVTPERRAERPAPAGPPAAGRSPRPFPVRLLLVGLVVLGLVAGVAKLGGLLPRWGNPFTTDSVDRTQPAVLKALEDLREYRAATGHFQVIVDLEEDARFIPAVIKGERTLFVAAGNVDAGVDFSRIGADAVTVSEDRRRVAVALPRAQLSDARVDPARSYVYERERGVLDRLGSVFSDNPTSERGLYLLAERRLAAAARDGSGLTERAEQNTEAMLRGLLRSLGFTEVSVRFS